MPEDVKRDHDDPSVNVIRLVGNAAKYLEDLHKQSQEFLNQKLLFMVEAVRRESAADSARIDANRANDIEAVKVANDRAIKQAELLNAQMLDNAEVLRKSVESTAVTIAGQFEKMTTQQNERIAALEKVNSENAGRVSALPNMPELIAQLVAAQNVAKGSSRGMREIWGWLVGLAGIVLAIWALTKG